MATDPLEVRMKWYGEWLLFARALLLVGLLTALPGCRKMTSPSATKSDKEQPSPDTDTSRRSHADGDTGILGSDQRESDGEDDTSTLPKAGLGARGNVCIGK